MKKSHDHSLWHKNQGNFEYENNYAYETFMATNCVPKPSRKQQLKEHTLIVPTFWEIITKRKGTFEWVEWTCSKS